MEKTKQGFECVLCKEWSLGWGENYQYGNNPQPLAEGQCCKLCDETKVIPARIKEYQNQSIKAKGFKKFQVSLTKFPKTYEVYAKTEEEAIEKVRDKCGFSVWDSEAEEIDF